MENLMESINKSCQIGDENEYINIRKSQYKCRPEGYTRESQINKLLEHWKIARAKLVDEKRGLLHSDDIDENDEWMDWQESSNKRRKGRKWINRHCRDQLMLSMWMTETPSNLESDWTAVVCPEGRRTLVIAKKGCTRAYHKSGLLLAKFKSILPNGAPHNRIKNSDVIVLDCIWNEPSKRLYALDVLNWKNQPLLDCDAQFRLYWLKSKLSDVKLNFSEESLEPDVYNVFLPEHCSPSSLSAVLEEHEPKEVDGILFYHNSAPYISAQTPLVGWLKPYMLPERLEMAVPLGYLDLKPANYTNLSDWVECVSHKHSRKAGRKALEEVEMDSSLPDSESSEPLSVEMEENVVQESP